MSDEDISVDLLQRKVSVRIRDVEITFWDSGKKLVVVSRMNFSGGKSTHLTNAEYCNALRAAAEKLGVKIKLRQAA